MVSICDPSARNESHVGFEQAEKISDMHDMGEFVFLSNFDALKLRIIILRPEMGSTPQY